MTYDTHAMLQYGGALTASRAQHHRISAALKEPNVKFKQVPVGRRWTYQKLQAARSKPYQSNARSQQSNRELQRCSPHSG